MRILRNPQSILRRLCAFRSLLAVAISVLSLASSNDLGASAQQLPIILRSAPIRIVVPALPSLERGLWLDKSDGLQAIAVVNGKKIVVASGADYSELNSSIDQGRVHKITQLQNEYGVIISRAGEVHRPNEMSNCRTREPMLSELMSLEYALARSNPSLMPRRKNSHALRICFLTETNCAGAVADWSLDVNDKPVIAIEPNVNTSCTLESILLHELAHHAQYRMGLNPKEFSSWKIGIRAGWHFFQHPGTGEAGWAMRTKDNKLFKFAPRLGMWVRCNNNGQLLDGQANRVRRQTEAEQLCAAEIVQHAMIRPATNYFCNPAEVLAEGMMLFRLNEESRTYLMNVSPELYELVRSEDQRELDKSFGAGNKIRTVEGLIVNCTVHDKASITEFENQRKAGTTKSIAMH